MDEREVEIKLFIEEVMTSSSEIPTYVVEDIAWRQWMIFNDNSRHVEHNNLAVT